VVAAGATARTHGWRVGLALALALGVVGSVPLLFVYAAGGELDRIYRSAVSLWVNAIVVGYVIGWPVFSKLAADVERLAPLLDAPARAQARTTLSDIWSNPSVWAARVIGFLYGLVPSVPTLLGFLAGQPGALLYAWVPIMIPLLWATALPALWRLIRLSVFVQRLGRDHVRVDLTDPRLLGTFADIGIRHLLVIVIGLSVIPMQAILTGSIELIDFVPALAVTAPVMLVVLVLPLWGIHRGIASAKETELDRVANLANQVERDSDRYLLLTMYRQQIAAASEWPVSAGSASRVLIYVVIPPVAWIAAAVVENLVSNVLSLR
jgi:hypothetical protein